ncbi:MAG TPA: dihydropteroate synthase [Chthoniobacteraceae bacterium]|nr:dihydropteroate synthase [Chthoniobacteraceae bacterium]
MLWQTATRTFDLTHRALIMGVVNVTTDSFSDGGLFADTDSAVAQARRLADEGAEIIDIGGESTRPGALPVAEEEELRRVLPVIERLSTLSTQLSTFPAISIDTRKPAVARAAVARGAAIVNDVSGLRDPAMREAVRATGAGAIAMHMQGEPQTMQRAPHYADVTSEIRNFFRQIFDASVACGIDPMCLAFDPGIGFGKTVAHNLALLRNLESMRVGGRPLVLGASRKSFIGKVLRSTSLEDREWPTVALTAFGRARGASVFRVHEARPNLHALRMMEAILQTPAAA